ncbi:MAG: glycosyltransferase [Paludibacteraceae bacterium]|nr:glycosyltransferase [Paludibacteraceae bacterium]
MMKKQIMVTVVVLTYNQEQWIAQTLDSILAQKTEYPFEVIIGEDWGTDNTRKICEKYCTKYPNVKLAPQDHNLGVVANWVNCIQLGTGKYIMNCGGDDYWHNPSKIQLQVDYMETHPECILCHTDMDVLHVKTGRVKHNDKQSGGIIPPEGRIQKDILAGREHISAVTMCFRRDKFNEYIPTSKFIELNFPREDWPTLVILSAHGDINYIPVSTATYRVGQPSISNEINYDKIRNRYERDLIMTSFLFSMFPEWGPIDQGTINYYKTHVYHSLLMAAYENNDYKLAREFAVKDPTNTKAKRWVKNWFTFQLFRLLRVLRYQ